MEQEQKDREHREPLQQVGVFPERAHISAYQSSSTASCSSSGKSRRFVVQCPFCKETISADAVKCSHCRSAVGAAEKSKTRKIYLKILN